MTFEEILEQVIERYDGYIAQYRGDGLMVYFGWLQAHEDDAQRGRLDIFVDRMFVYLYRRLCRERS